ncbi:MAG: hypothetical protein AAFP89_25575 [Bacteroidota bacterium]
MKYYFILLILWLGIPSIFKGQTNCDALLNEKLMDITAYSSTSQFEGDIKEVFELSDQDFERRASRSSRNGSFGFKYKDLNLSFGSGKTGSASYERFKEARRKYRFERRISDNDWVFFKTSSSQNILAAYEKCIETIYDGRVQAGLQIEKDQIPFGAEYEQFILDIRWIPGDKPTSQSFAKIKKVTVVNYKLNPPINLEEGAYIQPYDGVSQGLSRIDPNKPAQIVINVEGFSPLTFNSDGKNMSDEVELSHKSTLPVGTILSSILSFADFKEAMYGKNYKEEAVEWLPADGSVSPPNSPYFDLVFGDPSYASYIKNEGKIPDLRGVFLRGKNSNRSTNDGNPEGNKPLGTYQRDELKSHDHPYKDFHANDPAGIHNGPIRPNPGHNKDLDRVTSRRGGAETRPRNVTINFYIKIK